MAAAIALACGVLLTERTAAQATERLPQTQQANDDAAYAQAIDRAVEHFSNNEWQQALTSFERAHVLQPSARTFRGIGLARYALQDYPRARTAFEHALSDARRPLPDAQRREVEQLLSKCVAQTGRVATQIQPSDAQLTVDGAVTSERELILALGEHHVQISAPGYAPSQVTLRIAGGEAQTLLVSLAREGANVPSTITTQDAPPAASTAAEGTPQATPIGAVTLTPTRTVDANTRAPVAATKGSVVPWIALSTVPVFALSAGALWLVGQDKRDDIEDSCRVEMCSQDEVARRERAAHLRSYETSTNVLLGASAVALVTAGVLFLVLADGDDDDAGDDTRVVIAPGHVTLQGRF